ncbi:MAG: hypothetical protein Q3960_04185 [Lactobacillus sp.]|nr:hypothetical protein [Lactobacillus sp.]
MKKIKRNILLSILVSILVLFSTGSITHAAGSLTVNYKNLNPSTAIQYTANENGWMANFPYLPPNNQLYYSSQTGRDIDLYKLNSTDGRYYKVATKTTTNNGALFDNLEDGSYAITLASDQGIGLFLDPTKSNNDSAISNGVVYYLVKIENSVVYTSGTNQKISTLDYFGVSNLRSVSVKTELGNFIDRHNNILKEYKYITNGITYLTTNGTILTTDADIAQQARIFMLNGVLDHSSISSIRSNLPIPILTDDEVNKGYEFIGWKYADSNYNIIDNKVYSTADVINKSVSSDVYLVAQFALKSYSFRLVDQNNRLLGAEFATNKPIEFDQITASDLYNPMMLSTFMANNDLEFDTPLKDQLAAYVQSGALSKEPTQQFSIKVKSKNKYTFVLRNSLGQILGSSFSYNGTQALSDLTENDAAGLDDYLNSNKLKLAEDFAEQVKGQNGSIIYLTVQGDVQPTPGPKGDKGDTGEQGPKGDKGDTGEQGPKGDKGDTGEQGSKGDKGEAGERGLDGKDGKDGKPGIAGSQGLQGLPGQAGAQGLPGTTTTRTVYVNTPNNNFTEANKNIQNLEKQLKSLKKRVQTLKQEITKNPTTKTTKQVTKKSCPTKNGYLFWIFKIPTKLCSLPELFWSLVTYGTIIVIALIAWIIRLSRRLKKLEDYIQTK